MTLVDILQKIQKMNSNDKVNMMAVRNNVVYYISLNEIIYYGENGKEKKLNPTLEDIMIDDWKLLKTYYTENSVLASWES